MRAFVSREGKLIQPKPHQACFLGRNNSVKSKCLMVLYSRQQAGQGGLTLRQLASITGASLAYLENKSGRWWEWRYVNRSKTGHHWHYSYTIAKRGVHFLQDRLPDDKFEQYQAEIQAWQA